MSEERPVIGHSDELELPDRDDGSMAEAPDPPSNAQETIGGPGDEG